MSHRFPRRMSARIAIGAAIVAALTVSTAAAGTSTAATSAPATTAAATTAAALTAAAKATGSPFVTAKRDALRLQGRTYTLAGTNNYYLMYGERFNAATWTLDDVAVTNVLDDAAAAGLNTVRMWGFFDVQDPVDRSTSLQQGNGPTWFQAWDETLGRPVQNDGEFGLVQLDYAIAEAAERGLKLVIPFVNNWDAFGGIDQYVQWRSRSDDADQVWYHDDFYTDPVMRDWYKAWVDHVLNRTNTVTGVTYKDDPTIAMWELANEPRCRGNIAPTRPGACDVGETSRITGWADEMSTYISGIDANHLVSLGDEGWFCDPTRADEGEGWACTNGVDTAAVTALPNIDAMGLHMYPEYWGYADDYLAFGNTWITEHAKVAKRLGKPVYLGEFGLNANPKNVAYKEWLDTARDSGVDGTLYWLLSAELASGQLYPDYDGHTVYCPSPVCTTISNNARRAAGVNTVFPPVADNDSAETLSDVPVSLGDVLANDVAYGSKPKLERKKLDLDQALAGFQSSVTVAGGTFAVQRDRTVLFTPAPGFAGTATTGYTIDDTRRKRSNVAQVSVLVRRPPGQPVQLYSFEGSTQGWTAGTAVGDTLESSTEFATDGISSLKVTAPAEGWLVAPVPAGPIDLSAYGQLTLDVSVVGTGSSFGVSFQYGDAYNWCQAFGGYTAPGGTATVTIDLTALTGFGGYSCALDDLTDVRQLNVFVNGGVGAVRYIDDVTLS